MKTSQWLIVALLVVGLAGSVHAAVLWDASGYELDAATSDGTGDYDPADYRAGDRDPDSTHVVEGVETYVQVQDNNLSPGAANGVNCLKIAGGVGAAEELWLGHGNSQDFVHYFKAYNSSSTGLALQYGKRISPSVNVGGLGMRWENGWIAYYNGSWQNIVQFTPGQWDSYAVELHWAGSAYDTWDFYINGVQVVDDWPMFNQTLSWVNNVYVYTRGGAGNVYLDDQLVTPGLVPEPAMLTLLAFGLPLLRRRR